MTSPPRAREFEFNLPIGYTDGEGKTHRAAVLRKMTGKEEAILADRRFQKNGGKLVSELLKSCLVRLGELNGSSAEAMPALYSADRNYLLLKLRTITFGPELEASYSCPSCGETTKTVENLDELPMRALAEDQAPDEIVVELEDGWTDRDGSTHTALTLRLPTGADEEAVAAQMRQNPSLGKNALLSRCLKSLGELARHRLEAMGPKILAELTLTDRRKIDKALSAAAPGVDLVRPIECAHCGHEFSSTVDLSHFLALG